MLRDGPVTDASARRCLGLPFEWHAKTPNCEPSRYLCTVCRRSCGFCTAPSAECADTAPESECLSSTDRSQRTTAARVLPTGACDDAMFMSTRRAAEVGAWEFGIHGWVFAANGSRPHVPNLASERAAALRSLRETTAVFIGDSNQRHQYSALAYFLQHSVWPPARNYSNFSVTNAASVFADSQLGRPGLQEVNSMLRGRMPRSRGSRDAVWKWRTFYNQSSAMLGDACWSLSALCPTRGRRCARSSKRSSEGGSRPAPRGRVCVRPARRPSVPSRRWRDGLRGRVRPDNKLCLHVPRPLDYGLEP